MSDDLNETLSRIIGESPKAGKRFGAFLNHLRNTPYDRDDPAQLLAYMISMAPRAKGQLFQDLWALWVSGRKRGGYFVEFGAASGVYLSNTWLLEKKMGWNGILAEPNPVFLESLQTRRTSAISAKCVYPRSGETLDFLAAEIAEYSRISSIPAGDGKETERSENGRTVQVETISLNDLLIEHGAPEIIDYLSVDTEGSELAILSAFDFGRWDVRSISVEHNFTSNRDGLFELLSANGFRRQWTEISRSTIGM